MMEQERESDPAFVPQTAFIPFYHRELPALPVKLDSEFCISNQGLSLITGEGELTALAFNLACRDAFGGNLLYLRLDEIPQYSPFITFLNKKLASGSKCNAVQISRELQTWPPLAASIPDPRYFIWLIAFSGQSLWKRWQHARSRWSFLEDNLSLHAESEKRFTHLIIEGEVNFEPQAEFQAVMRRLKTQGMNILIVTPEAPPSIINNDIWDSVISTKRWRTHRCGERRLVAEVRDHTETRLFQLRYIVRKNKEIWISIPDKRDFLRKPVKAMMDAGLKSKEIVAEINRWGVLQRPLTEASLAALKRFWGFRTYRLEKKPRIRRTIQLEQQETFPLPSSDETM